MHLSVLDWIVLVFYFAGLAAMGMFFSRRQTSREEYQLARRIHWLLAGGSLIATLLSTLSFVALPGEMIRYGPALFTSLLALPLTVAVISRVVIPTFKAMPYNSAYEYLDQRFGGSVRQLAALVFVTRTTIWMGLIIYTCCIVVTTATGWDLMTTILIVGIATTFYATAGGFRTVVYSDNIQLLILLGGALAIPTVVYLSLHTGPVDWWVAVSKAGHAPIQFFSFDPMMRLTLFGAIISRFFWTICTHGSDQVVVQRYLSTPDVAAARRTLWTAAFAETILIGLLMVCGTALFALYQHRSGLDPQSFLQTAAASADALMPRFIVEELPSGLSGLVVAALLAAAMSSLSSGVNSVSSVVVGDLIARRGSTWESGSFRVDYIAALAAGLAGTLIALAIAPAAAQTSWNLVDLMERLNHIFVGPLAVLFFSGILFRHAGLIAALVGFTCALACSLLICVPGRWLGLDGDVSFMWIIAVPAMVGMSVVWLVTRLRPGTASVAGG